MASSALPADKIAIAFARITAWRDKPDDPVACPVCEATGLAIVDQSARPYAEWYSLTCQACGLDTSIHIPMAPPMPSGG
ncbi:MAG TPA: hypothetical protein VMX97_16070 [Hyphomicrobiaceae bacterium]|nr:hypothetical protein [Hyphomicrobiaceae bacterium]